MSEANGVSFANGGASMRGPLAGLRVVEQALHPNKVAEIAQLEAAEKAARQLRSSTNEAM